jgi:hypothetical protein
MGGAAAAVFGAITRTWPPGGESNLVYFLVLAMLVTLAVLPFAVLGLMAGSRHPLVARGAWTLILAMGVGFALGYFLWPTG